MYNMCLLERVCQNNSRLAPEEISRERHGAGHETCQSNDVSEVSASEFNTVRSKLFAVKKQHNVYKRQQLVVMALTPINIYRCIFPNAEH